MTTQVRSSVFETNSSSTHSLSIADDGNLLENPFSQDEIENGVIQVESGGFGWEEETFYDVQTKLSYLFTAAMWDETVFSDSKEKIPVNPNEIQSERLDLIREAVKKQTGLGINFCADQESGSYYPFGYIDHQSDTLPNDVFNGGVDSVINFVFNPKSWIKTDNDNH